MTMREVETMNVCNKATDGPPLIEWGVAAQAFAGRVESGDQYLIEPFPKGVLVAVVDGLGHSNRAAAVAKAAIVTLKNYAHEPVIPLFKRCHEELRGTRGVVMSLASLNALESPLLGTMTWLGVGNVEGLLLRADGEASPACERLVLRGGVVGYKLPTLRPITIPITRGATLIFATDGLRSSFAEGVTHSDTPQQMADHILAHYGRGTDDALVLVTRYIGRENT